LRILKGLAVVAAILALGGVAAGSEARDAHKDAEQLQKAANVVREVLETPDKGIPDDLMRKAVCVGVVPAELRFAFVVGGDYGRGVLVCRRGGNGPWGPPSMFTVGGASVGFQIGGKATDVVFVVMNPSGARKLVQDSVKLGADASVAAGPVGRTAEGATDAQMHAEILSYSRSQGVFAGVALDGAVLKQDRDDNQALYGRRVTARQIVIQGIVGVPPAARPLDHVLAEHCPRGGQPFNAG
jgi:SH3 domain-containing YSC84-like protein 1